MNGGQSWVSLSPFCSSSRTRLADFLYILKEKTLDGHTILLKERRGREGRGGRRGGKKRRGTGEKNGLGG